MEWNSTLQKRRKPRLYLEILEACFPQRVLHQGIFKLTDWVKGKVRLSPALAKTDPKHVNDGVINFHSKPVGQVTRLWKLHYIWV